MTVYKLTHAKHDRAHCLCPGLFRSFKKGERKKTPLNVVYDYGDERIEISGPELLSAFDLRVLQGLIAMSGPKGVVLHMQNPKTEAGEQLVLRIEPRWDAIQDDALVVKDSFYHLAQEIGLANPEGGKQSEMIRDSVERLWKVSMIVQKGKERRGFRILGDYSSNNATGKLFIGLNPRIAAAVLGTSASFTTIDMHEVRAINSDAARLIHQRLCGFIDKNKHHPSPISIETLCGYVWHDVEVKADSSQRQRNATVKKAVAELVALGWTFAPVSKTTWRIGRPKEAE